MVYLRGSMISGVDFVLEIKTLGRDYGLKQIRVRIDVPKHFRDQARATHTKHAHVEEKRGNTWVEVQAINPDGTGSHKTKAGEPINAAVAKALRDYGWSISEDNVIRFLPADLAQLVDDEIGSLNKEDHGSFFIDVIYTIDIKDAV